MSPWSVLLLYLPFCSTIRSLCRPSNLTQAREHAQMLERQSMINGMYASDDLIINVQQRSKLTNQ